ncbi:MAG: hypothetical protein IJ304_01125 [Clostridia bacterium]|nr:hypothetical protein [Clostridia bacterium]
MIKVNPKKREITDTIWTVIETFGFSEVEYNEGFYEDSKKEPGKYYYFAKNSMTAVNSQDSGEKAKADLVALCVEIAMVCGKENVTISLSDEKLAELLCLFGFENIIKLETGEKSAELLCLGKPFAKTKFEEDYYEITLDLSEFLDETAGFERVQASLIFAETDAEGMAYDIAYNLRMNGCIVEYYTGCGTIDDALLYTKEKGLGCILRVYSDGKLMINDFAKNEIIETTASDFLGYYDDDEEEDECDCGCGGHHHHHDHDMH